jgi:hypothetical protein
VYFLQWILVSYFLYNTLQFILSTTTTTTTLTTDRFDLFRYPSKHTLSHTFIMADEGGPQFAEGCFPRINGGMLQTRAYNGMIVSLVGKVIAGDTMQTADGTNVHVATDQLAEGTLMVNPDLVVELMALVMDETSVTVSILYFSTFLGWCCRVITSLSLFSYSLYCHNLLFCLCCLGVCRSRALL